MYLAYFCRFFGSFFAGFPSTRKQQLAALQQCLIAIVLAVSVPAAAAEPGEFQVYGPELFVRDHFFPFDGKDLHKFSAGAAQDNPLSLLHAGYGNSGKSTFGRGRGVQKKAGAAGLDWLWTDSDWLHKLLKHMGPYRAERSFPAPVVGDIYLLRVYNGPEDTRRVVAGRVLLNGRQMLGPRDFARGWWGFSNWWGSKRRKDFFEFAVSLNETNSLQVEINGRPGSGLRIEVVGLDSDAPQIESEIVPPANEEGWHNSDATVSFICSDALSGIANCSEPVVVSEEGADQQVSGSAVDLAQNTASVTASVSLDKAAPEMVASTAPEANAAGWHKSAVTFSYSCSDALSGVLSCPQERLLESEGRDQAVAATARDKAGNTVETVTPVNIDFTPPEISVQASPAANAAGWNNTDVAVQFACSDALSGIASCSDAQAVSQEGAGLAITGLSEDIAGNSRSVSTRLNIDKTPPLISALVSPAANDAGWHNSDATVSFDCSDTLSGIVNCPETQTLTEEGQGREVSGSASDLAGNGRGTSLVLNLDKTPPQLDVEFSAEPNAAGWHSAPVTLTYSCSDALSGVAACPQAKTMAEEGEQLVVSASAQDKAGNSAQSELSLKIDQTAPSLAFTSPTNGAALVDRRPQLLLAVNDNLILDATSLSVAANGIQLAASCQLENGVANCSLQNDLPAGQVSLSASVSDMAGNSATAAVAISIDSDGDGVADDKDLCPDTPAGEAVDSEGCSESQRDDDGDGVANSLDQCPGTPAGEAANGDGCSPSQLDTDGDGILNADDQCPNTVPGTPVEADGCDNSQRDSDQDGVIDLEDAFPEDPEESSDLDGDGTGDNADTDRDGDGVENDLDLFPENPNESADLDEDGIGDNADTDRDGDGVENDSDAFPDDPSRHKLPVVMINSPATLSTVGHTPVTVTGVVDPDAVAFTVNGLAVPYGGGQFSAQVSLHEGHNTVVARMVDATGTVSTASISVALDLTPPYITVDSHEDGQTVHSDKVSVTGLINDIVRGTIEEDEATVTVNGVAASIVNRSYQALDIPLQEGENTLTVEAVDQVGNSASQTFTLSYEPLTGQRLEIISGNGQSAKINTELSEPLAVKVLDNGGNPVVDKNVVFRVIQGSGIIGIGTELEGRGVLAKTDAEGIAYTRYRLGQRAGVGNQKVRARVVGYGDEAVFSASASGNIGNKLSVNSGNNQRGGTHQPLPAPFVVVVTDEGANVVPDARIRFEVVNGGGHFQNDSTVYETQTDGDGRASAHLMMGGVTGLDQQRVKATLLDAPVVDGVKQTITAGFTASAFKPGDAGDTSISGVVMDNQDTPLPGVTVRVDGTTRQAVSDAEGQFKITEVPAGPVHLIADGSTTTVEGEYPALAYNLVTVSGVDNPLSSPIYMVKLNTENAVWAGKEDVELTLPEVPGFKLEIPAGSVTFPDGSREGYVSVTVVNSSKVPMTPPNGMQPQFIVTIQPTNALFDPPARLTLPNVDGHTPGAQVEMFSFDHDLEEFVAIGLGSISEDGTVIRSNPGVGVVRAGWHCGAQPGGSGTPNNCDYCHDCDGTNCILAPDREAETQIPGNCYRETCGGGKGVLDPKDEPEDKPNDCVDPSCDPSKPAPWDDTETPDIEDKPGDCRAPVCKDGKGTEEYTSSETPSEDSGIPAYECKKCSDDGPAADSSKNGVRTNDGQSCCFDGGTIAASVDYETLQSSCPNKTQNEGRDHQIDGCSNSPDNVENAVIETRYLENFDKYVTLPEWGSVVGAVDNGNTGNITRPCNLHDICYQTCGKTQLSCDQALEGGMRNTCAASYPNQCPYQDEDNCLDYAQEREYCFDAASFYFTVLSDWDAGSSAYQERQSQYCMCCPE
ncbi:thrombospondin type 3 repeat-containing protein [Microbulbifer rhizosphaerae]|uniref:Thrombospondin type 3 repeat-containing protein n=1 Tax=Microbulbifer rhizosphaerae TaxID=1562603 RepID=A0A7W4WFC0_9GAMM|nr:thrombospondin type 3 repeat-containing protein [Microbulbifer rhizosphaerae]MBB3063166.1 hypothetical protein [Microbulbifer rhizosphaerae]